MSSLSPDDLKVGKCDYIEFGFAVERVAFEELRLGVLVDEGEDALLGLPDGEIGHSFIGK